MPEASDMELLQDYDQHGSEAAFAGLVQRHIGLVYSVAMRHVGIPAHAEEITQAVFIILARKAAKLRPDTGLAGWLHATTRLTALSFQRGERRRQFREQEAYMQSTLQESAEAAAWNQLAPLLDEAVARLGQKDRDAVMLRFFKAQSLPEVATALNVSEPAAQRRVHRAVEKLRRFFTKRGVALSSVAITGAISANSIQAAPVALAHSVTAVAVAKGAAASGSTLTLIKGALKTMAWTKARTAIMAGAIVLAAGTASSVVHSRGDAHAGTPGAAIQQFEQTTNGRLSLEAVHFLKTLILAGRLPGIAATGPAAIEIPWMTFDPPGGTPQFIKTNLTFPLSLTLTVRANVLNERYHYVVTKAGPAGDWRLQKAWCADTNDVVLKEFPIP